MRVFLLSLSVRFQILLIVGATVVFAFAIAFLCSMFFDAHQLADNTALTSAIYQVMGTIYAILLTFTLWGIWQNFSEADSAAQHEAYSLLDLVHMMEASSAWKDINIRSEALVYLKRVIEQEWLSLNNISSNKLNVVEQGASGAIPIIKTVQSIIPRDERESILFSQILTLLNKWLDARRTRMLIARGNSAKALWPLLLAGACVLFAFHGLFIANTIGIWIALLFGVSLVIGLTLYLIFTLDSPFSGSPSIDSEPFILVNSILMKKWPE